MQIVREITFSIILIESQKTHKRPNLNKQINFKL